MDTARNLIRSSVARTVMALVSAAIAFFMMPFLVGHLGDHWYGVWVLVGSLAGNYYLLDFGLSAGVTRFVTDRLARGDREGANVVINTALCLYSAVAVIIALITCAASALAHLFVTPDGGLPAIRTVILVVGLQYAAEFPFKAFAGVIGSHLRYDLLMYSRFASLLLTTVLTVVFVQRGGGIVALATIGFLGSQVSNAIYFRIVRWLFPDLRVGLRFASTGVGRELLHYSSWAFAIDVANRLRFRMDSVVIGGMISAAAVTQYAVGQRIVETFSDFVYRATNITTPLFTQHWSRGDYSEIRRQLLLLTRINAIVGLFGGGIIVVVGRSFILRWMGDGFAVSYPVLCVLMASMVVQIIGLYGHNVLYAMAKLPRLGVINVVEGILNLVLSMVLAHFMGIVGVALGTALPLLFFRLIVVPLYVVRLVGLSLRQYYATLGPTCLVTLVYLVACALLARPLLALPSYLSVLVVVGIATPLYAAFIPFVAFQRDERHYLWSLLVRGLAFGRQPERQPAEPF